MARGHATSGKAESPPWLLLHVCVLCALVGPCLAQNPKPVVHREGTDLANFRGGLSKKPYVEFPPLALTMKTQRCRQYWNITMDQPLWQATKETIFKMGNWYPEGKDLATPHPIQRILTWEDVERPFSQGYNVGICRWPEHVFYGTPERFVKTVDFNITRSKLYPATYIPIWKSASTTITQMLLNHFKAAHPHKTFKKKCRNFSPLVEGRYGKETAGGLNANGEYVHPKMPVDRWVFQQMTMDKQPNKRLPGSFQWPGQPKRVQHPQHFMFTFVRDPLDRFLAAMRTVQFMSSCVPNSECMHNRPSMDLAEAIADGKQFEWSEHFLSQMYFLSATTANGMPLEFDFIGRYENLAHDLRTVLVKMKVSSRMRDRALALDKTFRHDVPKVDYWTRENVPDEVVKMVCLWYAQDYECLGYPLPKQCQ